MITHGQPISNFREPVYASLAPKCFSIDTLQQFHSAKSQLYLLNSCNAGDTVNSNSEMVKVTNEIIGFTTILMQNRRAKVIASKWPLLDTLGFIFTQLFYRQLAESNDINKAYARSIYLLATQPNTYFLPLLAGVKDEALRAEKEALLNRAKLPFGLVYLYTTLNLYSLV
jgi:CHAT domain-containing protein